MKAVVTISNSKLESKGQTGAVVTNGLDKGGHKINITKSEIIGHSDKSGAIGMYLPGLSSVKIVDSVVSGRGGIGI